MFLNVKDAFIEDYARSDAYSDYLHLKKDDMGKFGFTSYHKCTVTVRMLGYGVVGDLVDEYIRMSESTYLESTYMFRRASCLFFCR
jgi:hypothetical protein